MDAGNDEPAQRWRTALFPLARILGQGRRAKADWPITHSVWLRPPSRHCALPFTASWEPAYSARRLPRAARTLPHRERNHAGRPLRARQTQIRSSPRKEPDDYRRGGVSPTSVESSGEGSFAHAGQRRGVRLPLLGYEGLEWGWVRFERRLEHEGHGSSDRIGFEWCLECEGNGREWRIGFERRLKCEGNGREWTQLHWAWLLRSAQYGLIVVAQRWLSGITSWLCTCFA